MSINPLVSKFVIQVFGYERTAGRDACGALYQARRGPQKTVRRSMIGVETTANRGKGDNTAQWQSDIFPDPHEFPHPNW